MKDKDIEKAVDETIEDLKAIFKFKSPNNITKLKTLHIPGNKLGTLRYLLIKNLRRANHE